MSKDCVEVSTSNGMTTLALNRPEKRNAMNKHMVEAILHAIQTASHDETRVLLIYGKGEHFCAGADINWMKEIASSSHDENYADAQMLADLMYQVYLFPKPTIVLAQGATLGGGLGLISACDIAIAASNASFGFSEVKIGLAPSTISPYVIAAIGERAAHYYFLTGERFGAEQAQQMGLVHQLTDDEALQSTGLALANTLLLNSPQALKATKQLIRSVSKEKISPELAQKTAEHLANLRSSPEAQEGLRAFIEKRVPKWA